MIDLSDTSTLSGSYRFISMVDKSGELGLPAGTEMIAGEEITFSPEPSVTMTLSFTGTLTLTETRYTFSMVMTIVSSGQSFTETQSDSGAYAIQGSTMTVVSDDPEEGPDSMTISVDGDRIILEDSDARQVFEKI